MLNTINLLLRCTVVYIHVAACNRYVSVQLRLKEEKLTCSMYTVGFIIRIIIIREFDYVTFVDILVVSEATLSQ